MKAKRLLISLLALLTFTMAWADVEINEANFPDENFRNWVLAQEYGKDGLLTDEEIAGVNKINVSHKNIQSLKGIEYFTALTSLSCYTNQLTSLDVSQNTALTSLYCDNNQLTRLDLSNNMALETLECRNNRLTTLNVSELAALSNLYCYNNQLTSLVVSGCSAMTILDCRMNQLTELDVTDCTELFYLRCTSNQLTALDVSKNTKLDELDCRKNRLTELNVSYNTKIGFLRCSENMLTELDASNLSEVISIYCQQNQLTVLRVPEGNTNLNFLYCYQNQIKGKAMDALLESMPAKEAGVINDFRVIYSSGEQNILTKVQAQAIKAKNWTPLHHVGGYSWEEYEGSDEPTGIRPTPDPSRNGGETYDLSGRKISSKPQRGIYIEKQGSAKANGRKVVK